MGADKADLVLFQNLREAGIFRKKAIAGMNRICAGNFTGCQNLRNVEITLTGRRRPDTDALIGQFDMHCLGIGGGMNRNRLNAKFLAGSQYTKGDFTPVCDQNLRKHGFPLHS